MSGPTPEMDFTKADADSIYTELRKMHVDLDADPLSYGPKRLNGKVSEVRKHLDRCERIYLDVSQKLQDARREHRIRVAALEMKKKSLIADDPVTRAGRSVADRDAIASGKLSTDIEEAHKFDVLSCDLEAMMVVVKAKRADLKDVQNRLKDQIQLCREELGLGSRWGSKVPNAPDLHPGKVVADIGDVEGMLGSVDGEIHLQQKKGEWENPPDMDMSKVFRGPADETPPEPETPPVPAEEPSTLTLQEEPEKDLQKALPPSAPQNLVDGFLGNLPDDDGKKSAGGAPLAEDALDSILGNFEKVD